jgi:hypothetical protein
MNSVQFGRQARSKIRESQNGEWSESGEFHSDTLVGESVGGRVGGSSGRLSPPPVADCDRAVTTREQFR